MNAYEQINCLQDIGIISGSKLTFYVDIVDENGADVSLSNASSYGCKVYYYGTKRDALTATASVDTSKASRMKIDISSSATANLGGKCLEYIPFVTINGETTKYGKGRIVVGIG